MRNKYKIFSVRLDPLETTWLATKIAESRHENCSEVLRGIVSAAMKLEAQIEATQTKTDAPRPPMFGGKTLADWQKELALKGIAVKP